MKKAALTLVVLAVGLSSTRASAQLPPIFVSQQPYQPLTAGTPVPGLAGDDNGVLIPLGFTFPYFGQNYTHVMITTNGVIVPGIAGMTTCNTGCLSNVAFPSTSTPRPAIAAWWDDLNVTGSAIVRTLSSPGQMTIEYFQVPRFSSTATVTVQIKLSASGSITFHYGNLSAGTGTAWSTSAGFDDSTGLIGANLISGCTSSCSEPNFPPSGTMFTVGEPNAADLAVSSVTIANFVSQPDGNLNFTVNSTLRNFGRTAATGFFWRAYISRDLTLDLTGGDQQVAEGGPFSLDAVDNGFLPDGGLSIVAVTASAATTTPPATGEYYVLVQVDPTDTVVEASETNNVGSTLTAFVQGIDLVATSIWGPASTGYGLTENFAISFFNRGTTTAGTVAFRVLLSADALLDTGDTVLFSGTRVVSGGQTISEIVPAVIPANAPSGPRFLLLQLDPANTVPEANELNNVVASAAMTQIVRPDLIADQAVALDPITGNPTSSGRLGEAVRARFTFHNGGLVAATNFRVALALSRDTNLSLLVDAWVCDQTVASLAPGATQTITLDCTLPLNDALNVPFVSGPHSLFALVDVTGVVPETNEGNNVTMTGPISLAAPGPDLIVTALTVPAVGGVGDVLPVERTLRNQGNVAAAAATYRYFASSNAVISTTDVPLLLKVSAGTAVEGSVTLAAATSDTATDLLIIPSTLAPGTWFIGCVIDFGAAVTEADESNNSFASAAVAVVGSPLSISTLQIPDAVSGHPYAYQLLAQGGLGLAAWSVVSGQLPLGITLSQGGLLTGTATGSSMSTFSVQVVDGSRVATAMFVLRVLPALTPLEIVTTATPDIVNDPAQRYHFALTATGGTAPYTWRVALGALPENLTLSADGQLSGNPAVGLMPGNTRVLFQVDDATGARAERELLLRVVSSGSLVLQTHTLPAGLVGQDYSAQLAATNGDGSLTWNVVGALPEGITFAPNGLISGRPVRAGSSVFSVSVTDAAGRNDVAQLTLQVYPARLVLSGAGLPAVFRAGDAVSLRITTTTAATFTLASGQLPQGVTLQSDGSIGGTIAANVALTSYDFVVEATDGSGASGLGAFTIEVEGRPMGCSTTGSPLAMLVLGCLMFLRKRHALGLTLAIALVPAAAQAQYQVVVSPTTYRPLTNSTSVPVPSPHTLPFAFPWFGDTTITSVAFSPYGYLAIGGSAANYTANMNVPHSSTSPLIPQSFIAPWWDGLAAAQMGTGYRHTVTGVAPFRVMAFEWTDVGANNSFNSISFEVELYETTGRIRFLYSAALPGIVSASVGLQKELSVGVPGLTCASSASCTSSTYPAGQAIDFFPNADLEVVARTAPQTGYAGVSLPQTATIKNRGGRDASVVVRFFLSSDNVFGADTVLGDSSPALVPAGAEVTFSFAAPIPASVSPGPMFLFAQVDPDFLIVEQSESNNVSASLPLLIGAPMPNLVPLNLQAPATAQAGTMIQVSQEIRNVGNANAGAFPFAWYLSDNAALSVSDRQLSVTNLTALTALTSASGMTSLLIPADVTPGTYRLGVCVNYDAASSQFVAPETSRIDNCAPASGTTVISAGALAITTTTLPLATPNVPYATRLTASGGDGTYAWTMTGGGQPPGFTLSTQGDLAGTPANPGMYSFEVRATSAGSFVTATLLLVISSAGRALEVISQALPSAQRGVQYEVDLFARGGVPPYRWAMSGGPAAFSLAPSGTLSGRPSELGQLSFNVEVTDSAAARAQGVLTLSVLALVAPEPLRLTASLADGTLDQPMLQALELSGGQPPFTLALVHLQQLSVDSTDEQGPVIGDGQNALPMADAMGLTVDGNGSLAGSPQRVGLFSLEFRVTDGAGAEDRLAVTLRVNESQPLRITTSTLADAVTGVAYQARVETGVVAQFSLPCQRQASQFACVQPPAPLPPGLLLASDGTISGTPIQAGTFTFLVEARDTKGRKDLRAFSVEVNAPKSEGCSTTGLAPLAYGLLLLLRARKRR